MLSVVEALRLKIMDGNLCIEEMWDKSDSSKLAVAADR